MHRPPDSLSIFSTVVLPEEQAVHLAPRDPAGPNTMSYGIAGMAHRGPGMSRQGSSLNHALASGGGPAGEGMLKTRSVRG